MSEFHGIPVVESGRKYRTAAGFMAVKNGLKSGGKGADAKQYQHEVLTKSSVMLGLGETDVEIRQTLDDLRNNDVDIVTFGQYLRPTMNHLPVERYVAPEAFAMYRRWGLERGFMEVVAGPLVRSSYRAERVFEMDNVGL